MDTSEWKAAKGKERNASVSRSRERRTALLKKCFADGRNKLNAKSLRDEYLSECTLIPNHRNNTKGLMDNCVCYWMEKLGCGGGGEGHQQRNVCVSDTNLHPAQCDFKFLFPSDCYIMGWGEGSRGDHGRGDQPSSPFKICAWHRALFKVRGVLRLPPLLIPSARIINL